MHGRPNNFSHTETSKNKGNKEGKGSREAEIYVLRCRNYSECALFVVTCSVHSLLPLHTPEGSADPVPGPEERAVHILRAGAEPAGTRGSRGPWESRRAPPDASSGARSTLHPPDGFTAGSTLAVPKGGTAPRKDATCSELPLKDPGIWMLYSRKAFLQYT